MGLNTAAWVTFGARNYADSWAWRIPSVLQALIPFVALPGFLLSPESPRWLISVDHTEKARKILADTHAGGDSDGALVNYEVIEIVSTLKAEKEANDNSGYLDMIKTKGNRHRLFIYITLGIFAQWSGNGVVSYYLALVLETVGITSVTQQTLILACLQVWNLIFAVSAAFSVDKLGRRPLFLASAATMTISYMIVTGLSGSFAQSGNAATGVAVVPFLFIFFAGYDIALSRGLTVTWVSTVLAIFFNTFINPIALSAIGWKYYIVFVVVPILFGLTAYFYYPETRGHTLEQMAVIFDGEDADVPPAAETAQRSMSIVSEKNLATSYVKQQTTRHDEKV